MSGPAYRRISEEQYLLELEASDIPLEFIDGLIYPRAASSLRHCRINTNLLRVLLNATQDTQNWVYTNQMRLRLAPPQFHQVMNYFPDIFVSSEESSLDAMFLSAPSVIVEITSEETYRIDTSWKAYVYRSIPSLQAYLMIDSESRAAELHRRTLNGWDVEVVQGSVSLPCVNISLSLAEVYDGVNL